LYETEGYFLILFIQNYYYLLQSHGGKKESFVHMVFEVTESELKG
jgi:hypothetical protein